MQRGHLGKGTRRKPLGVHGVGSLAPRPLARPVRGSPAQRARPSAYVTGGHARAPAPVNKEVAAAEAAGGARVGAARWGAEVSDCLRVRGAGGEGCGGSSSSLFSTPFCRGVRRGPTRFATHCQGALFGCTPGHSRRHGTDSGEQGTRAGDSVRNHAPPPSNKSEYTKQNHVFPHLPTSSGFSETTLLTNAHCPPPKTP